MVPSPAPNALDDRATQVDVASVVSEVIRRRRTNLQVDPGEEVADEVVDALVELATWAPNHKRTWPWRFSVLSGDARWRFGEALAAVVASDARTPPEKVAKLRVKYGRSPVVVVVWAAASGDAVREREDRDATSAAVQNLLLAATAFGLASYWGSLPEGLWDAARRFAGVEPDADPVAVVYLGWPTGTPAAPERPPAEVTWIRD